MIGRGGSSSRDNSSNPGNNQTTSTKPPTQKKQSTLAGFFPSSTTRPSTSANPSSSTSTTSSQPSSSALPPKRLNPTNHGGKRAGAGRKKKLKITTDLAANEPDSAVAVFVPGSNSPGSVNPTSPSTHLEAARVSSMESLSMVSSGHTLEPTQPERVSPAPIATAPSLLNPSISAAYQTTPSVSSLPTTSYTKPDMCIENVAFGTRDESILLKDLNVTAITDHFGELLGKIGKSEDQETLQARLLSVLNSGVVDCPIYTKGIFLFSLPMYHLQLRLQTSLITPLIKLMDDVYIQMNAGSGSTSVSNIGTINRTGILSAPTIASTSNIWTHNKSNHSISTNCVYDDDDERDGEVAVAGAGPVHEYVKEICRKFRTKDENNRPLKKDPLVEQIERGQLWIEPINPVIQCRKDVLTGSKPSPTCFYYRSCFGWFPDLMFPGEPIICCPYKTCPKYRQSDYILKEIVSRRIYGMHSDFFLITRRGCHEKFRISRPDVIALMPREVQELFPIVLTHHSGVTTEVIQLMEFGCDNALGANGVYNLLKENYTRNHSTKRLNYFAGVTSLVQRQKSNMVGVRQYKIKATSEVPLFSSFNDAAGYDGVIPSVGFLRNMLCRHVELKQNWFDLEVQRRNGLVWSADHTFFYTNMLARTNGIKTFNCLFSLSNEYAEIRCQKLVSSTAMGHLNYNLEQLKKTMDAFKVEPPRAIYVDDCCQVAPFYTSHFPSLVRDSHNHELIKIPEQSIKVLSTRDKKLDRQLSVNFDK
ncbi:hypothetical protein HDU76_008051, partial [Blyttiomyces sp. JEL0837]